MCGASQVSVSMSSVDLIPRRSNSMCQRLLSRFLKFGLRGRLWAQQDRKQHAPNFLDLPDRDHLWQSRARLMRIIRTTGSAHRQPRRRPDHMEACRRRILSFAADGGHPCPFSFSSNGYANSRPPPRVPVIPGQSGWHPAPPDSPGAIRTSAKLPCTILTSFVQYSTGRT